MEGSSVGLEDATGRTAGRNKGRGTGRDAEKGRGRGRETSRAAAPGTEKDAGQLPELSRLTDVPAFSQLEATADQVRAFGRASEALASHDPSCEDELCLGCVVRLDRGFPAVACDGALVRAEHAVQLAKADLTRPAVGDWVVLRRPAGHDMAVIEEVLPRTGALVRWRGGARGERQTLAANVGIVLVAQAISERRPSLDRIARSAVIALDCGASVAVVLTKADRATSRMSLADDVSRITDLLGGEVPVAVTASGAEDGDVGLDGLAAASREAGATWGDDAVRALVPAGTVAVVLGESGAGKSTLLNALLGHEALETGAVRERDDAGRHTTVARRMVALPGGGVVIDAPGLRSLPLVGHEHGLDLVFPDIAEASLGCRFRDCTHGAEPGCAVRAEVDAGDIAPVRLEAFRSLAEEMRSSAAGLDPDVTIGR